MFGIIGIRDREAAEFLEADAYIDVARHARDIDLGAFTDLI